MREDGEAAGFEEFGGLPAALPESQPGSVRLPPETAGRYTFPEAPELGRGAIGRVRLAVDEHLGREVAIKELLIPPGMGEATRQSLERRFLREARITARLDHPGVVPVHELGRRQDGTLFYAMKRIHGRTLRQALQQATDLEGRLRLLPAFLSVCQAVAYAHSRSVVHRDLKPENVVLGEFGETVVLDWGLAKLRGAADDPRGNELVRGVQMLRAGGSSVAGGSTIAGAPLGTPSYMSPEQAAGELEQIDERSDVWGLGVVLYELLAGVPPFTGEVALDVVGSILRGTVAPVAQRCAGVPAELAAVAEKCLSRERSGRYPDAGALARDLEAYLSGGSVSVLRYGLWDRARRLMGRRR